MSIELESPSFTKISPMMEQWHQCKHKAKDALLLFRMGDFYEAFYQDAVLLAKELELTLTQRQGIPMSGIPWHTSEPYIDRLVAKGYRVAIAEQMEDPKEAKGLVKRDLVRMVTPGTVVSSSLLNEKMNNYIVAICQLGSLFGMASLDLTTAEFRVIELEHISELMNEIYRLQPSECLISEKFKAKHSDFFKELMFSVNPLITIQEEWFFDHQTANLFLTQHFKVQHLDGFGLKGMVAAINAAGALLAYLKEQLFLSIDHIRLLKPYSTAEVLSLDKTCQRNLELMESINDGSRKNTLLSILDKTQTPMGGRLLRKWIQQPLNNVTKIENRLDAVENFYIHEVAAHQLFLLLPQVRDLERLTMKMCSGYVTPRDLVALRISLEQIPPIKNLLHTFSSSLICENAQKLKDLKEIVALLKKALVDEPPMRISEGQIFREGYHAKLDELKLLSRNGKQWLVDYQQRLKEETGIKTLKVNYNKIFGYYIEVSKGQAERMPLHFQRRQTLVNTERFISPELKEFEDKILHAEEHLLTLETELFQQLRLHLASYADHIFSLAEAIANLDCLLSLAAIARIHHYNRPKVDESHLLIIEEGRHPIVEQVVSQDCFISNDTYLDNETQRLALITGPNMSGKSTYMRQTALIVILAHMGSFVPAKKAHIGLVDKIFTRIGASDDLSRGQSTFMVEMTETANILHNATSRSLVLLDEIGRGTSTYDGISIAWSVAEYLLTTEGKQAKTLFATHYWELTKLEELIAGVVNYHVLVKESNDEILFLHKIMKGISDRSYGIHVGRLAGLPFTVLVRAQEILNLLEKNESHKEERMRKIKNPKETQLVLF